jgi:alkylation response protein AidB-like acyl-CoA dehydrogenase
VTPKSSYKELWAHKDRFEKKRLCLYRGMYEKAGDLGLLGVAVPEAWWIRNGVYQLCWFAITFLVPGSFSTALLAHIGTCQLLIWYGTEAQNKNTYLNASGV